MVDGRVAGVSANRGVPQASHRTPIRRASLDWQEHANCLGYRPEVFHDPDFAMEALSVCRYCPVQEPCATLGKGSTGVWGGRAKYPRRAHL